MKKLYVGNLSYEVTEEELRELFTPFGTVSSVNLIRDKFDNRSKGFGFVEMEEDQSAEDAINALDGTDHMGRNIRVSEARAKEDRGDRRGGRGGGGGGGHRGGGGGGFRGKRRDDRGGGGSW